MKSGQEHKITHEHDLTEVRHTHDFCELALITKGSAMHWLEGAEFPISAGDVFVLQGKQAHYYYDLQGLEMINIMYDPSQLNLPENRLRKIPGYRALFLLEPLFRKQHKFTSHLHLRRSSLAHCERIASELETEIHEQQEGYEVAMFSKFVELVVYLSRLYHKSESTNAEALLRVAKVIGSIEDEFARPWKIEDFAAMAHMSRSNFMRVFRTATGQTPIDYLLNLRIQKSTTLLTRTNRPVSEIAFEVGFNDSNYFSRQFKRAHGTSPLSYRRAH
ncbi:AraC family transcriptional regulator [Pelagicoccus sp. SDUM812003]|uniref:AraC family transcriptional regulator n=1 Tax=Pelagicoccus sp. SDUM812003 TaxID=3041267 RepID=UPI00280F1859|nr:AraC family transcriptional regulator [Pelagicoccus sp. SDUM812003]MDQ8203088.1 AraC family transcriptional regulator [Pelagicoccus sp. SDUM812003]